VKVFKHRVKIQIIMENCVCSDVVIRALRDAFTNLLTTTGNVMNTNRMSLPESGIGSIQTFSNPPMNDNNHPFFNYFSKLNLVILGMSILLIVSLLLSRNKMKSTYN
jgi:hypothetical protein